MARCLKVIETVKSLKPSKSVQFSLPTDLPVCSVQIAGGTEEDIKAKQKEKVNGLNDTDRADQIGLNDQSNSKKKVSFEEKTDSKSQSKYLLK